MNLAQIKFSFARGSGGATTQLNEIWDAIEQHVDITNSIVDKLIVTTAANTTVDSANNSNEDNEELDETVESVEDEGVIDDE